MRNCAIHILACLPRGPVLLYVWSVIFLFFRGIRRDLCVFTPSFGPCPTQALSNVRYWGDFQD